MSKPSLLGFTFIIFACLAWALDGYFRYPLLQQNLKAEWLVFMEHSLLLCLFFYPLMQAFFVMLQKASMSLWFSFFVIGALGSALSTVFFSKAMFLLNPSIVIVLQKLQPLFALLLSKLVLHEKLPWNFLFLAFMAIIGVGLLSYEDFIQICILLNNGFPFSHDLISGYVFAFLSVLGWSSATIFGKKIFNSIPSTMGVYQVLALRYFLGWIALLLYLELMKSFQWSDLYLAATKNIGPIFQMVLISAVLGMSLYYQGVKRLRPRVIIIAELWFPFLAIIVNAQMLNVHLKTIQIVGAAILVGATFIIQYKKS